MKKLLLVFILSIFMSASAFAGTWLSGSIERVIVYGSGDVGVELNVGGTLYNNKINADHVFQKEMFAIALTAKSTSSNVEMFLDTDTNRWNGITLAN